MHACMHACMYVCARIVCMQGLASGFGFTVLSEGSVLGVDKQFLGFSSGV